MSKSKLLLVAALFALSFTSLNVKAMKRKNEQHGDWDSNKRAKYSEIKWLNYSEFLNEIYHVKSLDLGYRVEVLCERAFTYDEAWQTYQMGLIVPDGICTLWCLYPSPLSCRLRIFSIGTDNLPKILFQFDVESLDDEKNIIKRISNVSNGDFAIESLANELLYAEQPDLKPIQNNLLTLSDFKTLMVDIDTKSLLEKIQILNNGPIGVANDLPVIIELTDGARIVIEIYLNKFRSNCILESDFLPENSHSKPGTLYYYEITLYQDLKLEKKTPEACSIVILALDAGYGDPHLSCELYWIERTRCVSGKKILELTTWLFEIFHPKIIYLRDYSKVATSASSEPMDIFFSRPIMCGKTLYAEFAGFKAVNCEIIIDKNSKIAQSQQSYQESVNALRTYKARQLLDLNFRDREVREDLQTIMREVSDDTTLGDLFVKLYAKKSFKNLYFLYEIVCNFNFLIRKKDDVIDSHVKTIYSTVLWKSTKYQRKTTVLQQPEPL